MFAMAPSSFHEALTNPFFDGSSSKSSSDSSPFSQTAGAMSSPLRSSTPLVPSSPKPPSVRSVFAQNAGFIPSANIFATQSSSAAHTITANGFPSSVGIGAFSGNQFCFNSNGDVDDSAVGSSNVNTKSTFSRLFGAVKVNDATCQGSKSPSFAFPPIGTTNKNRWAPFSPFGSHASATSNSSFSQQPRVHGYSPFTNGFSNTPPATTSMNQPVFNSASPAPPKHLQFPQVFKPQTPSGGEGRKQHLCPECGHTFKELGSRVVAYSPATEPDMFGFGLFTSISAMAAYTTKSHEELRWEDYLLQGKRKSNGQKNSFETLGQRSEWAVPGMPLLGFIAIPWSSKPAPLHSSFSGPSLRNSCNAPFMIAPLYGHQSLGMPSPPGVVQLCDMFRQL